MNKNTKVIKINKKNQIDNSINNNDVNNLDDYLERNRQNKENYNRPELTYTDKLSKAQIYELLYDYEKINDPNDLYKINPGYYDNANK
jgi:hypothetical protein